MVLGNIEMLMEDLGDDPDALELLQMSYSAGTRINEIVQQMKSMRQAVTKPYLEGIEIIDLKRAQSRHFVPPGDLPALSSRPMT